MTHVAAFLGDDEASITQRRLQTELLRIRGPEAVLGVHRLQVFAVNLERVDRMALATDDEVGRVEADALVVETDILNSPQQRYGCLLASVVEEGLPVLPAMAGHFADSVDDFTVERVIGVFRDKATVGLERRNAALSGEVGRLLERRHARRAKWARHQANGFRPLIEIIDLRAGAGGEECGGREAKGSCINKFRLKSAHITNTHALPSVTLAGCALLVCL